MVASIARPGGHLRVIFGLMTTGLCAIAHLLTQACAAMLDLWKIATRHSAFSLLLSGLDLSVRSVETLKGST